LAWTAVDYGQKWAKAAGLPWAEQAERVFGGDLWRE